MNDDILKVLYSREQIQDATEKMGKQITKDFEGKDPLVICILRVLPFSILISFAKSIRTAN